MTDQSRSDTDQCPVCGQPYEHTFVETPEHTVELRDDLVRCREKRPGEERVLMYVHQRQARISTVKKDDGDQAESGLRRLFE